MKLKRICIAIAILLFALALKPTKAYDDIDFNTDLTPANVIHVVDGDTVIVKTNNQEKRIRMIGVNTPESVSSDSSKNCPEGKIASDYTKSVLKQDMVVYLEYDEDDTDIYGRTLAYIWLNYNVDTTDYSDFCKYNYGAILLQNTYCESVYYAPNGKYKTWYDQLDKLYQPYNPEVITTNKITTSTITTTKSDNNTTEKTNISIKKPKIKAKRNGSKLSLIIKNYSKLYTYQIKFKLNNKTKYIYTKKSKTIIRNLKKDKKYNLKIRTKYKNNCSKWTYLKI